ncbi:MAG: ribonuclease P protein component [Rhodobacteraceae bacterium]|nr:ribonuclease P protein component [Paracoccaceae bacterium]
MSEISILKKRAEFLKAAKAESAGVRGLHLQARQRDPQEPSTSRIRLGITCSKKVGNAVMRNSAKRRLREAARMILPTHGKEGWDYVLIGRRGVTIDRPWDDLLSDLQEALAKVH